MITNIKERLDAWKADGAGMQEMIEMLSEFQQLSGVDNYLSGDAEDFFEIDTYTELLNGMAQLAAADVTIADISAKEEDGQYVFSFTMNNEASVLSMAAPDTDWLQMSFLEIVNEKIAPYTNKGFYDVFATGLDNVDQCFDIAYLDAATFANLANHPAGFAQPVDEE
jgi:hypothetical protein